MKKSVIPNVRVPCVGKCELTSGPLKSSKGATAFVLQLHNYVSMCFINCHLEANKPPLRRAQFKTIVEKLGKSCDFQTWRYRLVIAMFILRFISAQAPHCILSQSLIVRLKTQACN